LFARLSYSLNDIFVGRLARRYGRTEVAAFRGTSLGLSMAPLLLFVPLPAFGQLLLHPVILALTVSLTALGNLLHLNAARLIPFGLRAALMISSMAGSSLLIGWAVFDERLTALQVVLCVVLVGSGVGVALGTHTGAEIEVDARRGAAYTLSAGAVMACAMTFVKLLARDTHPLLAAWAWEFGAGAILLVPAMFRPAAATADPVPVRFLRVALASLPTALASGASVLALDFGELGLWGALGGTQILFTAAIGALWYDEALGRRRWALMMVAAAAVAGLALARN
jgi:drug/metabolite transporter (DMT)-like permease